VVQNNVGHVRLGGPEELTLADWRAAVAINLDTVFLGAKATLAHLVETRGSPARTSRFWRTRPRSTPSSRTSSAGNDQSLTEFAALSPADV
jgi:NAD(P)-dependent dehydrogenase (short-subunit alcohol dehydrogenase family)